MFAQVPSTPMSTIVPVLVPTTVDESLPTVKAQYLDNQPKVQKVGFYKDTKNFPVGQFSTIQINSTGAAGDLIIQVPPGVYNFGQGMLTLTLTPAATNASVNWMHLDGLPFIRDIYAYTSTGGVYLVNVQNFDKYLKAALRRETKFDDMQTWGRPVGDATPLDDAFEGLTANNSLVNNTIAVRPSAYIPATSGVTGNNNVPSSSSLSSRTNYEEARYAVAGTGANTGTPKIKCQIPLSRFINTFLAMNTDIPMTDTLNIKIVFNGTQKFTWLTPALTGVQQDAVGTATYAGGAAPYTYTASTATVNTTASVASVTVDNICLYLPQQTDPVILEEIQDKVRADKFIIPCPWLQVKDLSQTASAQHNISMEFGPADGARLKKIYWSAFNSVDTAYNAFDNDNSFSTTGLPATVTYGGGVANPATTANQCIKISNFQTKLDNQNLSGIIPYDCSKQEDYIAARKRLRGSCILTQNEYYYNWAYIEDFTDSYNFINDPQLCNQDMYIQGLSLDRRHTYVIQANLPASMPLKHIVALAFIRSLRIPAVGVPTQADFL